jgi:5-formyltetrahydrofolate cyclo-ligase
LLLWSRATVRTGIAGDAFLQLIRHTNLSPASHTPATVPPRPILRRELRARRAALPAGARAAAERRIAAYVARLPWLRPGVAVALYVSRGSEVDTAPLRRLARARGCRVFLPRITDYRQYRCVFAAAGGRPLRLGRLRIAEPTGRAGVGLRSFALVLLPLVGFDDAGNRLGNGAGYYDRMLAFRRGARGGPVLVGVAFECQRCAALQPEAHDVPLDAVVTERGIQYFGRGRAR